MDRPILGLGYRPVTFLVRLLARRTGGEARMVAMSTFVFGAQPKVLAPDMEGFKRDAHDDLPLNRAESGYSCALTSKYICRVWSLLTVSRNHDKLP